MHHVVNCESLEGRKLFTAAHGFVYAPHSTVDGKTLGQWAAEWVKWIYKTPKSQSALFDDTGANAKVNQPGDVFFLAGTFGGGPATRKTTVPAGEPIFFPVVNSFWSGLNKPVPGVQDQPDPPFKTNEPNIRALFQEVAKGFKNLSATVDGNPVYSMSSHREEDPKGGFKVTFPQSNNILGLPTDALDDNSATIGIYLMLKPLSVGTHTIHFKGTSAWYNPDATEDITYKITVVSSSNPTAVPATAKASANAFADGKSIDSLVLDG